MITVVFAIRSLDIGGAERQFIELVKHIDKSKFDVTVCTMYGGEQENIVQNIPNIRYHNLRKKGRYDFHHFHKNYSKVLKDINPHVIYSFLGEMNFFSLWCKPKKTKVIWGFRASNIDLSQYGKASQLLFWLQKKLSSKVTKIITNSNASIEFHKAKGFDTSRSVVIHNGIDTQRFKKDATKRLALRKKYHLPEDGIAIGIVARIDYMKGHLIFATCAKKLLQKYPNLYFFSIGSGDAKIKKECQDILMNEEKFFWLENQKNIEDFYSGLDIVVSSSFGEGFSNSIAEAMSCECACVVTDVGDSALIVAEFGIVVQPYNIESLHDGLEKMLHSDFRDLGKNGAKRIRENFSIPTMVLKTEREIAKCVE